MLVRRPRASAPILVVTLIGGLATGCSGGGSTSSDASSATPAPVTRATGSPFTATLTGPEIARAGDTITVTITNTGRLPNDFQLDFQPAGAATATPRTVTLPAGRSAPITVQVASAPFNVNLESASGGLGDYLDTLEVGANG